MDACAIESGELVVDVAAGTGNVTDECLQRGALVLAVDLVHEQLVLGSEVYRRDGVAPVVADGARLPLPDAVVDAALSTFWVLYAEDPGAPLPELARVVRGGGRVGITTWAAGGFAQEAFAVLAPYTPDLGMRLEWTDTEFVREQMAKVCDDVVVTVDELRTPLPSVEAYWARASTAAPPLVAARKQLNDAEFDELGEQVREVARRTGEETDTQFVLVDRYIAAHGTVR